MTEAEWLVTTDPKDMLTHVGIAPQRKLRLFACACCRRIWNLVTDVRSRRAVEIAERYADGIAKEKERASAERQARRANEEIEPDPESDEELRPTATLELRTKMAPYQAASYSVELSGQVAWNGAGWAADALGFQAMNGNPRAIARRRVANRREEVVQCSLLRDIFGNPFRLVTLNSRWLTPKVTKLVKSIYADRAFDRLPILADALQDAGCEDADILSHCRGDGPHVRGCWVVDLMLGKE